VKHIENIIGREGDARAGARARSRCAGKKRQIEGLGRMFNVFAVPKRHPDGGDFSYLKGPSKSEGS